MIDKKQDNNKSNEIEKLQNTINSLSENLIKSEKQANKNWELYIREKAEIENIKKRTNKEVINTTKYAIKNISKDLLSILDSLEQCLINQNNKNNDSYKGIKLIYKILSNILNKHGVEKILIQNNTQLDPLKHEIISIVNIDNNKINNKIIDVLQNGYILHNHILRYAKVTISKNS